MASFSASIDPSSLNFSFPTSGDYSITSTIAVSKGLGDRIAERTGSGVPKFKSCTPPSLPISPSFVSSSSQFSRFSIPPGLSPSELLDSPVLLYGSNILPSPTTGSFSADAINWRDYSNTIEQDVKLEEDKYPSDFTFEHQANVSQSQTSTIPTFEQMNHLGSVKESNEQDDPLTEKATEKSDYDYVQTFSPEIANIQEYTEPNKEFQSSTNQYTQSSSEQKRSEDGYNWRKYGQKQVKGSENPRSYYKCTYPNCISKKKVERCLDGQIAQIVYRGNHNHPKPDSTRRSSNYSLYNVQANDSMDHSSTSNGNGQLDSSITQDNSSISVGDCDFEQSFEKGKPVGDEFDDEEPEAKRWKRECENEGVSAPGSRAVREPRIVVQTTSEIDILDDGYRWRKYGQKVVRGNPNPRSYYKCTFVGCTVRKHVERASHDLKLVITTYEGRHNHDIPAARGAGNVRGYLDYSSIH